MTQENESMLLEYIYDYNSSISKHESRSFTFLLRVLQNRLKEKLDSSVLQQHIADRLKEKDQDNNLLLFLFLQSMEEDKREDFLSKPNNHDISDVENNINEISSSSLPEPEIYKGWGFKFKQEEIEVKQEKDGKNYLSITIDEVFDGSKLKEMGFTKCDTIKIELDESKNIESLKSADGKFDVGKVSAFVRNANSITKILKQGDEKQVVLSSEQGKGVFVKVGDKHINFEVLINQEEENKGDKKNLEEVVKKAFRNTKDAVDKLPPSPIIQKPEGKRFGTEVSI